MNSLEGEVVPVDYNQLIHDQFHSLVNNPKYSQIAFLIDMEGVILPLHFPKRLLPSVYRDAFNPLEDKIVKANLKLLPTNGTLIDYLKFFVKDKGLKEDFEVLIISTSQMELAPLPKVQHAIDRTLDQGLFKTHDLLQKIDKNSYHEITDRVRLKKNSLLINIDDTRFPKTLISYIGESQPESSSFSVLPIKITPFENRTLEYQRILEKELFNGLKSEPISFSKIVANDNFSTRQLYNQLSLKLKIPPSAG